MANEKGYQGWTNYETWAVNLHITNDYSSNKYWRERAEELNDELKLADELKAWLDDYAEKVEKYLLLSDLLNAALKKVDYFEIARAFMEK